MLKCFETLKNNIEKTVTRNEDFEAHFVQETIFDIYYE
jgi:hypothetical protein